MQRSFAKTTFVCAAAAAAALTAGVASTASAGTITWMGVDFETQGSGTATIDTNGDLLLMPTGSSFGVHTNRIPDNGNNPSPINANDTPYISFSYDDPGGSQKIDVSVQDESATGGPRASAGSLFSHTKVASATYGSGNARGTNEQYLFYKGSRAAVSHDALLGHTADGTLYAGFDGESSSSDIFKDQGIDFDFNDVMLRARDASGDTIRFTDFGYGDDFSPSQIVPAPQSASLAMLGMVGLGGLGLLSRRRRRAC